jgi:hypothetical protein
MHVEVALLHTGSMNIGDRVDVSLLHGTVYMLVVAISSVARRIERTSELA